MSDNRATKAKQIAATKRIAKKGRNLWLVPSQSHSGQYVVELGKDGAKKCSCPDHETRNIRCKHIIAVEITRNHVKLADGTAVTTETVRVTYGQNWSAYNKAQTHEKQRVSDLLHELCGGIQSPERTGAGRPRLPLGDVVFGSVMKVYTTVSGRRAATDIRAARDHGLIEAAPHYNSISRYLEEASLTPLLSALVLESATPLADMEHDFAVDSSGFSTSTYARWFDHKWGREMRKNRYLKAHLISGVKTHVVTHAIITDSSVHDSPMFKELVEGTARRFDVKEVSADKAYLSKKNFDLVAGVGGVPYIPFKSGAGGHGGNALWQKLWHCFQFNREDYLKHYHKRSNAETVFSMMKAKFGGFIRSKLPVSQTNEVLCKVIAHNLCQLTQAVFEFGLEPKFWTVKEADPKSGEASQDDLQSPS